MKQQGPSGVQACTYRIVPLLKGINLEEVYMSPGKHRLKTRDVLIGYCSDQFNIARENQY